MLPSRDNAIFNFTSGYSRLHSLDLLSEPRNGAKSFGTKTTSMDEPPRQGFERLKLMKESVRVCIREKISVSREWSVSVGCFLSLNYH